MKMQVIIIIIISSLWPRCTLVEGPVPGGRGRVARSRLGDALSSATAQAEASALLLGAAGRRAFRRRFALALEFLVHVVAAAVATQGVEGVRRVRVIDVNGGGADGERRPRRVVLRVDGSGACAPVVWTYMSGGVHHAARTALVSLAYVAF